MTMARAIIIGALAGMAVLGCTTGERISGLQEGMTPAQVTDIMGAPTGQQRAGYVLRYEYTNALISGWSWDRADFYAVFENDKLTQWGTGEVRQNQPNVGTLTVVPFPPGQ
jgi:hypothetical protein